MYDVKQQLKLANAVVHMYAPAFCIGFRFQYHVVEDRPISDCAGNLTSGFELRLKTYGSHLRRRWQTLYHRCPLDKYQDDIVSCIIVLLLYSPAHGKDLFPRPATSDNMDDAHAQIPHSQFQSLLTHHSQCTFC